MTVAAQIMTTLSAVGLSETDVADWLAARPTFPPDESTNAAALDRDRLAASRYVALGAALLHRLPAKPRRSETERAAATALLSALRDARTRFLRVHADQVYAQLTHNFAAFLRIDELVYRAAETYPGLTPTRAEVTAEDAVPLKDKEGIETDQGIFLSQILARPRPGAHLIHAMLRPKPESLALLDRFQAAGSLDLGPAAVERRGAAGYVYIKNVPYLNAEDDAMLDALETAVDLALLDPSIEVCVLRGARVDHPKYQGRHVFCAGLNLTRLYGGKLSFLFYMVHDLAVLNKFYRGLARPEFLPDEPENTLEKPWIAAVEAFAIGGGCQMLLVMDRVLAESGSYFNLPARKEGIIPGCANLRLTRFVGDRLARQGILFDRQFPVDSPEGRLLCDEVVPLGDMDRAIEATVEALTTSGMVSASANRKTLRLGQESLAQFQAYMATYAREQADCHFSPTLVQNLERYWNARKGASASGSRAND